MLYVLSLKRLTIGLAGLIESGSLFAFPIIDSILGYFNITPYFILLLSMIFYGTEPYLIKIASDYGANEISINIGYYIVAMPYFLFMLRRNKQKNDVETKNSKSNMIKLIILIFLFESLYFLFGTIGYIGESATINAIIHEIRVFLLVILSVIAGTDKMTSKKVMAIILGIISVVAIYLY